MRRPLPSPSLLGAHGWRAVLPLSVKCVAFVLGATVALEVEELASRARSAARAGRLVPTREGAWTDPGWNPEARASLPTSSQPGAVSRE
jgi:hypothetical protein